MAQAAAQERRDSMSPPKARSSQANPQLQKLKEILRSIQDENLALKARRENEVEQRIKQIQAENDQLQEGKDALCQRIIEENELLKEKINKANELQ